jgi:hypothetical protein
MTQHITYIKTVEDNSDWWKLIHYWSVHYDWHPALISGDNHKSEKIIKLKYKNVKLYHHRDALLAINPNFIQKSSYVFSDKELDHISKFENTFMMMIDRWSLNAGSTDYFILRRYFLRMIGIWIKSLKSSRTTIVICPKVPHRIYDFACYIAANILEIPFLMSEHTGEINKSSTSNFVSCRVVINNIEDRFNYLVEGFNGLTLARQSFEDSGLIEFMRKNYQENSPSYLYQDVPKIDCPTKYPDSQVIISRVKKMVRNGAGFYKHASVIKFVASSKTTGVPKLVRRFELFYAGISVRSRVAKAIEYYKEHVDKVDLNLDYVYVAPHYKPERTTVPDAGYYEDLELALDIISDTIPVNWKIYYKEHKSNMRSPLARDNMLDIVKYKRIRSKYPALSFVDIDSAPYNLIDNAKFVVTMTGTTGWQAITRGVPCLIFGDCWYRYFSGVFYVKTRQECQEAVQKVVAGSIPSKEKINNYAQYIINNSIKVAGRLELSGYTPLLVSDTEKTIQIEDVKKYCSSFVEYYKLYEK